jgi:hypothetical protein
MLVVVVDVLDLQEQQVVADLAAAEEEELLQLLEVLEL